PSVDLAVQDTVRERDLDNSGDGSPDLRLLHVGAYVFRQGFRGHLHFGFSIVRGCPDQVLEAPVTLVADGFEQFVIGAELRSDWGRSPRAGRPGRSGDTLDLRGA